MQFLFPVDGESGTQKDTLRFTESHLTRHSFLSATDLEGVFFHQDPLVLLEQLHGHPRTLDVLIRSLKKQKQQNKKASGEASPSLFYFKTTGNKGANI